MAARLGVGVNAPSASSPRSGRYDPRLFGAKCSECPLGPQSELLAKELSEGTYSWEPVPSEFNKDAIAFGLGEMPGDTEVKEGRPFVGKAGGELTYTITGLGFYRADLSFGNVIACKPPGLASGAYDRLIHRIDTENRRRAKDARANGWDGKSAEGAPKLIPYPSDCCRPRLLHDISGYENLIALGGTAAKALLGNQTSIMQVRGGPVDGYMDALGNIKKEAPWGDRPERHVRVLPTIHPSFVMQVRRWTKAFRADVGRALRWFTGKLGWREPKVTIWPTPEQLEDFLFNQGHTHLVYDVETTVDDPLTADLYCIGIGNTQEAFVVPFKSCEDGQARFYPDIERIKDILRRFFADPNILKVGWNLGSFDRMVIEQHFGVTPAPVLDGILLHRLVESELPHSLGFVASIYTDAPAWKADNIREHAPDDKTLHIYNGHDVAITDDVVFKIAPAVRVRAQSQLVDPDHAIQSMTVGLHRNGILVDQDRARAWDKRLEGEIDAYRRECRTVAMLTLGEAYQDFNPGSVFQLREILFERWNLPIVKETDLGDPSTDDEVLRDVITSKTTAPEQKQLAGAVRRYRRAVKLRGTYVRPCLQSRDAKDAKGNRLGAVWADGRMRADWLGHTVLSGRLSCSDPNLQNLPKKMREMYVPAPGNVFIEADYDQIELRVAAALAGCKLYLDEFANKGDPHSLTARMMFGTEFDNAPGDKKSGKKGRIRDFAKRVCYASLYCASPETVHEQIVSVEDDDGELIYADRKPRETTLLHRRWLDNAHEFERWWESSLVFWKKHGFIAEPILGRRRDCLDGEDMGALVNFQAQATAAAVINLATIDLLKIIPFGKWGPGTGLVGQFHDALMFEVPESEAAWACEVISKTMTREFPDKLPGMVFSAEADVVLRWKDDTCVNKPIPADGSKPKKCGGLLDRRHLQFNPKAKVCECGNPTGWWQEANPS